MLIETNKLDKNNEFILNTYFYNNFIGDPFKNQIGSLFHFIHDYVGQ